MFVNYLLYTGVMMQKNWNADQVVDQQGRVIVITGATSGIGEETAKVLAGKGAKVIIGARNLDKAERVISKIKNQFPSADISAKSLDLVSLESVKSFAKSITKEFDQLDVLINNAGIMACPYAETKDGFEIQFGTNHLAHFALTGLLMPLLKNTPNSRLVILSSTAHKFSKIDVEDLNWQKREYNTARAYADSKIANLLFMYELAERMKDDPNAPTVSAAHPGWTNTELQRHTGLIRWLNKFFSQDVDQGALPTLRAGFDQGVKTGDFFGPSKYFEMHGDPVKVKSNKLSHNKAIAKQVWQQSEKMTGISF